MNDTARLPVRRGPTVLARVFNPWASTRAGRPDAAADARRSTAMAHRRLMRVRIHGLKIRATKKTALLAATLLLVIASGCTVHPDGEQHERQMAEAEGGPYRKAAGDRDLPTLSASPTPDELVRYALLASPELEQHYWEWRSAIEQIPQDGTEPTNLVVYAGVPVTRGSTAFNRSTVTVANDPMADIVWPSKLSAAAKRALENARAAGFRFQQAKYDLRQRVLNAYDDYALAAELLRLQRADVELLRTSALVTEAQLESGKSSQSVALKARDDVELATNEVAAGQARLTERRSALNAILGRDPTPPLPTPSSLPEDRPLAYVSEQLHGLADERSPVLAALDAEARGRAEGKRLAKLQYLSDFSLSASTDLGGVSQMLMAMVTVPILKYQSINAAIAQAEANIRTTDAMRRQARLDLRTRITSDLASIEDADRELDLLEHSALPHVRQAVEVIRAGYEGGRSPVGDLVDAQRSDLALQRLAAQLRVSKARQLVDIEASLATTLSVDKPAPPATRHTTAGVTDRGRPAARSSPDNG